MTGKEEIRTRLNDPDPFVRRDACEAIGEGRWDEFVPELVEALRDEHPGVKEASLNALIFIGGGKVAQAVAPLLRESEASLRNIGIEVLQGLGPSAITTLSALLNDSDDDIVKFAVDILANIQDDRARTMLAKLSGHRNPNVRASVAVCIGRVNAPDAAPLLIAALDDPEEWVRFSAVEGLGLIRDSSALPALVGIVESGSGLIKEAAIEAISRIASPAEASKMLESLEPSVGSGRIIGVSAVVDLMEKAMAPGSEFRPAEKLKDTYFQFFSEAFDDDDMELKEKALKGLSLLKVHKGLSKVFDFAESLPEIGEEMEPVLVEAVVSITGRSGFPDALRDELARGRKTQRIAIKAIGELRCAEALETLGSMMDSVDNHALREIVMAIGEIGTPETARYLYKALESKDGHSRKTAAHALAALDGEGAVERLFSALESEKYRDVMEGITDAIASIPCDEVKRGFALLLARGSDDLREMGARGLGLIGDEQSMRVLTEAASDKSPAVRKGVYKSLARLGIPEAADTIISGLKDTDDNVRLSVLKSLGGWGGDRIRDALIDALRDNNIWVRYHAVMLLGDMGDIAVEDQIINRLEKDEAPVKAAAARALSRLGSEKGAQALDRFIDHPDEAVRTAVEEALLALRC